MSERPDLTIIDETHVLVTPKRKPSDYLDLVVARVLKPETYGVSHEVLDERLAQDAKWGEQNHPNGTSDRFGNMVRANKAKHLTDAHARAGTLTWLDILDEEVQEAYAESDPRKLRTELLQIAAVASAWVEAIDRRDDS